MHYIGTLTWKPSFCADAVGLTLPVDAYGLKGLYKVSLLPQLSQAMFGLPVVFGKPADFGKATCLYWLSLTSRCN